MIDHRLGQGFPADRREALWELQRGLDQRRLLHLAMGFITHPTNPSAGMAKAQVRAFAKALSPTELAALLDLSPADLQRLGG